MRLFFELIQIAIGNRDKLSTIPSVAEWMKLYNLAKNQSVVGLAYNGVENLFKRHPGFCTNLPIELKMQWIGLACVIKRKNELLNDRCLQLQQDLMHHGFKSCILKGQGLATLYNSDSNLSLLRESGDIDVWVDAPRVEVVRYVKENYCIESFDYKHLHADIFPDASVELHYVPAVRPRPFTNKSWMRFVDSCKYDCFEVKADGTEIIVPSRRFNLVYVLQHIYSHLFGEETTLKQYLDYYYVLKDAHENGCDIKEAYQKIAELKMGRFAGGCMWLMQEVFGLSRNQMLCEPNEKEGVFLLNRVLHKDYERAKGKHGKFLWKLNVMKCQTSKNLKLIPHYPMEVIMQFVWLVRHFVWKRTWIIRQRHLLYDTKMFF